MTTWQLKKTGIILAIIIIFSMALRINEPRADIPSHISFSGSIVTDEGNQCHNSRSKTLFGNWFPDDWRVTNYNPVLPWIKYTVFKTFGVGMLQLRLVNYIFAFLSLLFFFLTCKSVFQDNPKLALLATFLLGINFFYIMYNKIGTFETSCSFWVILTLYFLEKFRSKNQNIFLFLSGISAFMGFIFKSIMAYLLPLPFVTCATILLFPNRPTTPPSFCLYCKKITKQSLYILAGMAILFIPWYSLHYVPNREWIINSPGQYMGNLFLPKNLETAWHNFLSLPWKDQFYKIPIEWLGSIIYFPIFFRRLLAHKSHLTEIAFMLFFIIHTASFSIMSYRPTRYFLPIFPIMIFLTVLLFHHWLKSRATPPFSFNFEQKIILFFADTIWLALASYFCFIPLLDRPTGFIPHLSLFLLYFPFAALLTFLAYRLKKLFKKNKLPQTSPTTQPSRLTITAIILLTVIATTFNLAYYLDWYIHRTFIIRDISRELGAKLDHAYIAGMTAPAAALENNHQTLWLYPNFVNWNENTFNKYNLTHALLGTDVSQEIVHFFRQWPDHMNHAQLIKVYILKDYFLHLYWLKAPYISTCNFSNPPLLNTTIHNPSQKSLQVYINEIQVYNNEFLLLKKRDAIQLSPGSNMVTISLEPPAPGLITRIFSLDTPSGFPGQPLRYEAENFPSRTGNIIRLANASNHQVRFFDPLHHKPGFLSFGPAVPYAPGLLVADFHLSASQLKTKIKRLLTLDIYSIEDQKSIAELSLKPNDFKNSKNGTFRLQVLIPKTRTLEFRVRVDQYATISFDFLDLTYFQGVPSTNDR